MASGTRPLRVMTHLRLPRPRRGHRHILHVDGRWIVADRCLSGLLWWSAARAVCQGKAVTIDTEPVVWTPAEAREFLRLSKAHRMWTRDLPEDAPRP